MVKQQSLYTSCNKCGTKNHIDYNCPCECHKLTINNAFQDGPSFYEKDGKFIVSYPSLVQNNYDVKGAIRARRLFLSEYPQYRRMT